MTTRLTTILIVAALAACLLPACKTIQPDLDGETGMESPIAIATAAMYRQWGLEKSLALAVDADPAKGCMVLQTVRLKVEGNREAIDAYLAEIDYGGATASNWSDALNLVLIGIEATTTIAEAEAKAKEALSPTTSPARLHVLHESAAINYGAARKMWERAVARCGLATQELEDDGDDGHHGTD